MRPTGRLNASGPGFLDHEGTDKTRSQNSFLRAVERELSQLSGSEPRLRCGGEGGTRTPDPAIMSRVL
jgi:hypothetical protein